MIIIIPTIKYGFTYYNTSTMEVCSNGYFFQCAFKSLIFKINCNYQRNDNYFQVPSLIILLKVS